MKLSPHWFCYLGLLTLVGGSLALVVMQKDTLVAKNKDLGELKLKVAEDQKLFEGVWYDAYNQAAIDFYFKVPQIVVQRDGEELSVWKKTSSFVNEEPEPPPLSLIPAMPTNPVKKKR